MEERLAESRPVAVIVEGAGALPVPPHCQTLKRVQVSEEFCSVVSEYDDGLLSRNLRCKSSHGVVVYLVGVVSVSFEASADDELVFVNCLQ
jgi:hypothetical protein